MTHLLSYFFLFSSLFVTDIPKLTLHIQNIDSIEGNIIIGVFNTDKDFLKDGVAIKNYSIKVIETSETIIKKRI